MSAPETPDRPATPDPEDVIYGELVHWPLPTRQVTHDVMQALAAAGLQVVPVPGEQPAPECPTCESPLWALLDTEGGATDE